MVRGALWSVFCFVGLGATGTSQALASCSYDLNGVGYGTNCPYQGGGYRGPVQRYTAPQPSGPTPQQLRQEAADKIKAIALRGDYAAARRAAQQMQENDPAAAAWLVNRLNQLVFRTGYAAMESKRWLDAIREFQIGLRDWPNNAYGRLQLSKALLEQSRLDDPLAAKRRLAEAAAELRATASYAQRNEISQNDISDSVALSTEELNYLIAANDKRIQELAAAQEKKRQLAEEKSIASSIHEGIQVFAQSLSAAPGPGTGTFNTTIVHPDLDFSPGPQAAAVHNAIDQASSAENSGITANNADNSIEVTKHDSNCAFDNNPCTNYRPVPMNAVRAIGQTPAAAELSAHIPDAARNDALIQQSVAYYQRLDTRKIDTQAKLAAIEDQIKRGAGDAAVLKAQEATLNNDLNRFNMDQKKTQAQIKKRLVSIHVGWIEEPPSVTDAKPPQ